MRQYSTSPSQRATTSTAATGFMNKVYFFMTLGLLVTAAVAYYFHSHPMFTRGLMKTPMLFYGIIIVQLGAVLFFSRAVQKMNVTTTFVLFFLYSALTGVTFGIVSFIYTAQNIAVAFAITAGSFFMLSVVGYTTKKDLTAVGSFVMMGLWGLIIESILAMFIPSLRSNGMELAMSAIGVIVFAGLTAYDTQRIKAMASYAGNQDVAAVSGAFSLYLDFINLFLFILRFVGGRR